jgi:hypothetical protein
MVREESPCVVLLRNREYLKRMSKFPQSRDRVLQVLLHQALLPPIKAQRRDIKGLAEQPKCVKRSDLDAAVRRVG